MHLLATTFSCGLIHALMSIYGSSMVCVSQNRTTVHYNETCHSHLLFGLFSAFVDNDEIVE